MEPQSGERVAVRRGSTPIPAPNRIGWCARSEAAVDGTPRDESEKKYYVLFYFLFIYLAAWMFLFLLSVHLASWLFFLFIFCLPGCSVVLYARIFLDHLAPVNHQIAVATPSTSNYLSLLSPSLLSATSTRYAIKMLIEHECEHCFVRSLLEVKKVGAPLSSIAKPPSPQPLEARLAWLPLSPRPRSPTSRAPAIAFLIVGQSPGVVRPPSF